MERCSSEQILDLIQSTIMDWHKKYENGKEDRVIVTDNIKKIRELNQHREDVLSVIQELTEINTEIWHEEDKVRSERDDVVLAAIRNINPLNQHRNDLIEEIDEIMIDMVERR